MVATDRPIRRAMYTLTAMATRSAASNAKDREMALALWYALSICRLSADEAPTLALARCLWKSGGPTVAAMVHAVSVLVSRTMVWATSRRPARPPRRGIGLPAVPFMFRRPSGSRRRGPYAHTAVSWDRRQASCAGARRGR